MTSSPHRIVVVLFLSLIFSGTALSMASKAETEKGVLVFGGTGRLGSEIVKQLLNAGEKNVTVFARPTSDRKRLEGLNVNFVVGDANNEADVEAAFQSTSFRVVINALANPRTSTNPKNFYESVQGSINKWAKATGVERIIFHSSTGAGDSASVLRGNIEEYVLQRYRDKELAENQIVASGIDYTIIRNYIIRPEGTPPTGRAFLSEDRSVTGAIARKDLAILTLYCLDGTLCKNKTLHARDPDPLPVRE